MPENYSRAHNDELKRFELKQMAIKEKQPSSSQPASRYMQYRKLEQLKVDQMEHPEKYIPEQPKIDVAPEPSSMVFDSPPKKKSWFSKVFG